MSKASLLRSGRLPCAKCGKKGVGFASHPHAQGFKNYSRAKCRYCGAAYTVKAVESKEVQ